MFNRRQRGGAVGKIVVLLLLAVGMLLALQAVSDSKEWGFDAEVIVLEVLDTIEYFWRLVKPGRAA